VSPRRSPTSIVCWRPCFSPTSSGPLSGSLRSGTLDGVPFLPRHDECARIEIERHRGRLVDSAGDGIFATFDGPARAVRCPLAIMSSVHDLGIQIRAGVHTGEVELEGDAVRGIAVHVGARLAALAEPGQVLATSTVNDLVAGSGLVFEDRGEHELKGVPGQWRLYAVASD
jgi:class 3 adenylate cyclase